jgi:asparagine synthase (glutamine-hydrolysing)
MCGITSFLYVGECPSSHEREDLEKEIGESLEIVQHRGPDASGKWVSPYNRVGMSLTSHTTA